MRRLLLSCALVCALALTAFAGGPEQPGGPEPEGTTQSSSVPFVIVIVEGVPIVIWL